MPHLIVEYSSNVSEHHDIDALVAVVHEAALEHGLPSSSGLRTRGAERQHYRVMTGDPKFAFVAIQARVAPGRTFDAKSSFIGCVLDAAEDALAGSPLTIAWSIELTELDPDLRVNRNHVRVALEALETPAREH